MQPRSWSPFSFFLWTYFPYRVVASCSFSLKILSIYSTCAVKQWTVLPHKTALRSLVIFSLQKCSSSSPLPCPPLSLCQIFAFFFILLTVLLPLAPTHSNPLLSPTFPPLFLWVSPLNFVKHWREKKKPQANSQWQTQRGKACVCAHTHTHRHTSSSQPNSLYFSATLTLSTADFARSSLNTQCWSANRTHSTVLNMVRAIQPFLAPQTGSNPPSQNEAPLVCSARLVWT